MHLDRRKQTLLEAIVEAYVERAEPVGSQYLASSENLGVRSATIRNELAEMTDLGYLRQPHTSAGRIPSDRGYRYYVDHLMTWDRLPPGEARAIRGILRMSEGDLEQLLAQTCRVLSSLTRYTAMATPPHSAEPSIRQVHLVQVAPRRLLCVVVLDSGRVVHRFCEMARGLSPAAVTRVSNALDELLRDVSVSQVARVSPAVEDLAEYEEAIRSLIAVIASGLGGEEGELYMDGTSHFLEQPEFREANRIEPLVRFLEESRTAYEALRVLLSRDNVTICIGQENPHEAMHEVSLVAARYGGSRGACGWIGVLGPTRMQYSHAVTAVHYVARALSESLARMGVE